MVSAIFHWFQLFYILTRIIPVSVIRGMASLEVDNLEVFYCLSVIFYLFRPCPATFEKTIQGKIAEISYITEKNHPCYKTLFGCFFYKSEKIVLNNDLNTHLCTNTLKSNSCSDVLYWEAIPLIRHFFGGVL
jgi:hypothetical protein